MKSGVQMTTTGHFGLSLLALEFPRLMFPRIPFKSFSGCLPGSTYFLSFLYQLNVFPASFHFCASPRKPVKFSFPRWLWLKLSKAKQLYFQFERHRTHPHDGQDYVSVRRFARVITGSPHVVSFSGTPSLHEGPLCAAGTECHHWLAPESSPELFTAGGCLMGREPCEAGAMDARVLRRWQCMENRRQGLHGGEAYVLAGAAAAEAAGEENWQECGFECVTSFPSSFMKLHLLLGLSRSF